MYGTNCTITWGPPGIKVWKHGERWGVKRPATGLVGNECLYKDGSWGLGDWFASEREATVAAVLAGMESPAAKELKELKAANAAAQKRLAAKQAVVDQVCKERDEAKGLSLSRLSAAIALSAEVAKLKRDLAQASLNFRAILLLEITEHAATLSAQYAAIQPPPLPGEAVWLWRNPREDVSAQAADLAERFDVVVYTMPWQSPCDATLGEHEAAGIMARTDRAIGLVADLLCRLGYPRTAKAIGDAK